MNPSNFDFHFIHKNWYPWYIWNHTLDVKNCLKAFRRKYNNQCTDWHDRRATDRNFLNHWIHSRSSWEAVEKNGDRILVYSCQLQILFFAYSSPSDDDDSTPEFSITLNSFSYVSQKYVNHFNHVYILNCRSFLDLFC